jgi:hypothetical protein
VIVSGGPPATRESVAPERSEAAATTSRVPEVSPSPNIVDHPSPAATPKVTVETRSARLDEVAAAQSIAPARLNVDAIGISGAPIDPVGVEPDASMEIPTDVSRIGWYEYGPAPGDAEGTAVLTAHVDSRTQGRGIFYHLDALDHGDTLEVVMHDGTLRPFTVEEIRQIPKVDLPTGELFRRDGAPRLAMITCGGAFDPSSRHYRDNLVVLATPAG